MNTSIKCYILIMVTILVVANDVLYLPIEGTLLLMCVGGMCISAHALLMLDLMVVGDSPHTPVLASVPTYYEVRAETIRAAQARMECMRVVHEVAHHVPHMGLFDQDCAVCMHVPVMV